jgi:ketosteroid isomerase-like protein
MKLNCAFLIIAVLLDNVPTTFATTTDESAMVASTVEAFHHALATGNATAAMKLMAPDAVILESGFVETRAEYESHHLPEDIQFAQAVHNNRSDVRVKIDGDTAWLTSRNTAEGSFEGKQVNSVGVELVVLTKNSAGWLIRAIHWSSHKATKAD